LEEELTQQLHARQCEGKWGPCPEHYLQKKSITASKWHLLKEENHVMQWV
jgi:hypothetical protein